MLTRPFELEPVTVPTTTSASNLVSPVVVSSGNERRARRRWGNRNCSKRAPVYFPSPTSPCKGVMRNRTISKSNVMRSDTRSRPRRRSAGDIGIAPAFQDLDADDENAMAPAYEEQEEVVAMRTISASDDGLTKLADLERRISSLALRAQDMDEKEARRKGEARAAAVASLPQFVLRGAWCRTAEAPW